MINSALCVSAMEPMAARTFVRFSKFIQNELGIKMSEAKRGMLQARFSKRMRSLGINSYDVYCDYVFSPRGKEEEMQNMIDVVTTNKTDFFREPKHFDFLVQKALPQLAESNVTGATKIYASTTVPALFVARRDAYTTMSNFERIIAKAGVRCK